MSPILAPFLQRQRFLAAKPYLTGDILDLGCGHCDLLSLLASDQSYTGVDVNPEVVKRMRKEHSSRTFFCLDLDREPLHLGHYYDTVVMLAVLEHLSNPDSLIGALPEHLKPGGRIVLTTPTPIGHRIHHLGSRLGLFYLEAAMDHKTIFDRLNLKTLFERHGFHINVYFTFLWGGNQLCVAALVG